MSKKLTPMQKKVIMDLQSTHILVTSNEARGAYVCHKTNKHDQYHIGTRLFFNLIYLELIYQEFSWPFNYILTEKGLNKDNNQTS